MKQQVSVLEPCLQSAAVRLSGDHMRRDESRLGRRRIRGQAAAQALQRPTSHRHPQELQRLFYGPGREGPQWLNDRRCREKLPSQFHSAGISRDPHRADVHRPLDGRIQEQKDFLHGGFSDRNCWGALDSRIGWVLRWSEFARRDGNYSRRGPTRIHGGLEDGPEERHA